MLASPDPWFFAKGQPCLLYDAVQAQPNVTLILSLFSFEWALEKGSDAMTIEILFRLSPLFCEC